MSGGRHSFKKSNLVRALRAAKEAGLPVERVDIDLASGKISIIITKQGETVAPADALNDWLHKHADKTQGH